jgi:hypothetical protein
MPTTVANDSLVVLLVVSNSRQDPSKAAIPSALPLVIPSDVRDLQFCYFDKLN